MRSSNRPVKSGFVPHILLVAALVIFSRAPFLVRGDRFFDSDEAVEGLMARHVLIGEYPAFLWGQRYKGVPEVYLAAGVFAVTGSSVVALKGVTLATFALFVAVQFVLVERLFSRAVAWLASAFLIAGPPSLVLWSLSANAEVVFTMLAGTVLCLGVDVWRRTGSRAALATACAALGFGLWVQQYILYYVAALGVAVLYQLPKRREIVNQFISARDVPPWGRALLAMVVVGAFAYLALGAIAFFTDGFDLAVANLRIGVHHPQKLWQIAIALLLFAGAARTLALAARLERRWARRTILLGAAAFLAGNLPAILGRAAGAGSAPIRRADMHDVLSSIPLIVREVLPIVFGFRSPTTGGLGVPLWLALVIAVSVVASFFALRRRTFSPVFHCVILVAPLLFLASGAFVDAQSYRYLMPAAGAFSVVMALGIWTVFRRSRVAGVVALGALLTLFGLEQRTWYRELPADTQSAALVACLDRTGVRGAYADYWLSYKLTFLTGERTIVAPNSGMDRYAPYREYVRRQPSPPIIPATIDASCTQAASFSR